MDFDPGFHEEMHDDFYGEGYDEGRDDGYEEEHEEDLEVAEDQNQDDTLDYPGVYLAAAAGFGYSMAQDEIEERKLAEDILRRRDKLPERIALRTRHKIKGANISPARRAMFAVASGKKTTKDPIEYTDAEKRAILDYEGERGFEW